MFYNDYGYKENTKFWGNTQQITWHMDRFKDMHQAKMEEQTAMIELKFNNLISALKEIFTGQGETGNEESFFQMSQRENSETQTAINAHMNTVSAVTENQTDTLKTAIENHRDSVVASVNRVSGTTDEIENKLDNIKNKLDGTINTNVTNSVNIKNWPNNL